jgi:hypothetical protein
MHDRSTTPYSVDICGGVWRITYTEPAGSLALSFELGMPRDILYVPTQERWAATMPDWASGRRDQIITRIRAAFGGCEIVEVDDWYSAAYVTRSFLPTADCRLPQAFAVGSQQSAVAQTVGLCQPRCTSAVCG